MMETDPILCVKKERRKYTIVSILLALYVLSMYLPLAALPTIVYRVVLYVFLTTTLLKMIFRQTRLKMSAHSVWLFVFALLGLLSSLYASAPGYVFKDLYALFVAWVVSFSFIQYAQDNHDFRGIFFLFAGSSALLGFYLFVSGAINTNGERLGQSLYGNANRMAILLMLSLFCVSWLIIYAKRKYSFLYVVLAIVMLYITALTGGRKYLLVPWMFLFILIVLKGWRNNRLGLALYVVLFMLAASLGVWAVVNVPVLYNSVGIRLEGLLGFFSGGAAYADDSTVVRAMMMENGMQWFQQRPIAGYGLNNFSFMFSQILGDVYAHNNYIEILVDLGIAGFLLYYSFYVYVIVRLVAIRDDVSGVRDFFLAFMLTLPVFEIGAVTYQLIPPQIFLGLASGYVWLHKNAGRETTKLRFRQVYSEEFVRSLN